MAEREKEIQYEYEHVLTKHPAATNFSD